MTNIKNRIKNFLVEPDEKEEKEEDQDFDEAFLEAIVSKLGTCFATPEEVIL